MQRPWKQSRCEEALDEEMLPRRMMATAFDGRRRCSRDQINGSKARRRRVGTLKKKNSDDLWSLCADLRRKDFGGAGRNSDRAFI